MEEATSPVSSASAATHDPFDFTAEPASSAQFASFPSLSGRTSAQSSTTGQPPSPSAAAIAAEKRRRQAAALHRAADLIDAAEILILHTGAGLTMHRGDRCILCLTLTQADAHALPPLVLCSTLLSFSADSGLPVYRDVANLEPMKQRNLTYRDLCDPSWLSRDEPLFLGFWGHCFNAYRDTVPHRGYGILRRWRDERFHADTAVGRRLRQRMRRLHRARRQAKKNGKEDWWDQQGVEMQRDRGIFHPPETEEKDDRERTQRDDADTQQLWSRPAGAESAVEASAESVHITTSLLLKEEGRVQFAAVVDSSSASIALQAPDTAEEGLQGAESHISASFTASAFTTAIHTPQQSSSAASNARISPTQHASSQSHPAPPLSAAPSAHPCPPAAAGTEKDVEMEARQSTDEHEEEAEDEQEAVPDDVGGFFVLTSNVDAHFHRAGFRPAELFELHGSSERWQCAELCSFDTWTPPPHFRFVINAATLTCPRLTPPSLLSSLASVSASDSDDDSDDIVTVQRWTPSSSFLTNFPRCPLGHQARPNILMFNDPSFLHDDRQEARYLLFMHAVLGLCDDDPQLSVAVLEIGCGTNVPTVRWRSESVWQMIRQRQSSAAQQQHRQTSSEQDDSASHMAEVKAEAAQPATASSAASGQRQGRRALIRINPLESEVNVEGKDADCVSIDMGGLMALQLLDRLLQQRRRERAGRR